MSLVKPTITPINVMDATKPYVITFTATSGDLVVRNELEIYKTSDNSLIYTNKTPVPIFVLQQTIPANTMQNGITYKIRLRTYSNTTDYSAWSDWIIVNCFSNPVVNITNITDNGVISNQTYNFTGSYYQSENDSLQYYKYILYDNNHIKLSESNLLFDKFLQYQFTGFNNDSIYIIELQVTTQHNITVSIEKTFTTSYVQPTFSNLVTLVNNSDKASVDVKIVAIRTLGYISSGDVTIDDGEFVNTSNGVVTFDESHGMEFKKADWSIQLWCKNLIDNKSVINGIYQGTEILDIYGQNNVTYKLQYYDGCFHLYKFISNILFSHYKSNVINATVDDIAYLFCQSVDGRINLKSEIVNQ